MSICNIKNTEVGDLCLHHLSVQPVFGMMGAGEPTERGIKRELEKLRQGEEKKGRRNFFLQSQTITEAPIPLLRADAFVVSTWTPNNDCDMSCLSVVWLIDDLADVLSPSIKALFAEIKWPEVAEEFVFN